MKLKILQKRVLDDGTWYMCVGNLYDYLSTLNKDFYEYQIQRRIVRNIYLDKLYKSIIAREPLPPITLNTGSDIQGDIFSDIEVDMAQCDVLDGLQRTFRLWIVLELKKIIDEFHFTDYRSLRNWLRTDKDRGELIGSQEFINTHYLKSLFERPGIDSIINAYKNYEVTLSIWTGLSDDSIVNKMLLLNAGQRAVSSTHQYELLFLHFFDKKIFENVDVELFRERDRDYFKIKSGKRIPGQYQLSSIIVALQSLIDEKPYRISPANFIINQDIEKDNEDLLKYFNNDFLKDFLSRVKRMDLALNSLNAKYLQWFGKDTTLSGVFAALGHCNSEENVLDFIDSFINKIEAKKVSFELDVFDREYSQLSSVNINVGNVLRNSIYQYTIGLIDPKKSKTWYESFNK